MNVMELDYTRFKNKFKNREGVENTMRTTIRKVRHTVRQPRYAALTVTIALSIFLITHLFSNLRWLKSPTLILPLLQGIFVANAASALLLQAIIALLAGVSVSLMAVNLQMEGSALGITGIATGILSGGCTACGTSLLPLLGVAGGLAALPFEGKELYVAGIVLLLLSIHRLAKAECKVSLGARR